MTSFASRISVEDEQTQLIRFFQCTTRFVNCLPRNNAGRSVLPGVQRPRLDVAIRLVDVIRCAINPHL